MGAPTKRVPDVRKTILSALELGATKADAAHAAGVSYDLLNDWCNQDSQFFQAIKAAQATCRIRNLGIIKRAAASGTWQAAAWVCERTDPEHYGRTVSDQRHTGADGTGPIEHRHTLDLSGISDEELAILERVAERMAGRSPQPGGDPGREV